MGTGGRVVKTFPMVSNDEPLDLEAIKARYDEAKSFYHSMPHRHLQLYAQSAADVPALIAEVERLRAERDDLMANPLMIVAEDGRVYPAGHCTSAERDVIEKAKAWRAERPRTGATTATVTAASLIAAVDALGQARSS